ncbi:MAG: radical SAM protein [Bacteroidia bacterium]|nr:radical SAM protein [Bacteroidia bacterium]
MDSIFSSSTKWLDIFLPAYKKTINLPFFCNIEVRFQSTEILNKLCNGGMSRTSLGIQSGSDTIRRKIYCRNISNKAIIRAANILKKNNVAYQQDLLGFNPFDTDETLKETFDLLSLLPPRKIAVFKLEIFPNSELFRLYTSKRPQDIGEDRHKLWIYLWHLNSYGGKYRKYAQNLVSKYHSQIPIEALYDLQNAWKQLKHAKISDY